MKSSAGMTTMLKRVLGEQVHLEFQYTPNFAARLCRCRNDGANHHQPRSERPRFVPKNGGGLSISVKSKEVIAPDQQKLGSHAKGKFACLIVADTGCGIFPRI